MGERLLHAGGPRPRLSAPAVRAAFDEAVAQVLDDILERERGPLREQLDPELAVALDQAIAGLAPRVAERVASYARSPEFESLVVGWVARITEEVGDRPLAERAHRRPARRTQGQVRAGSSGSREGDELERTLRSFVDRQIETMSRDDRPLLDRLPAGRRRRARARDHRLPPDRAGAAERAARRPEARGMVEAALRSAFDHRCATCCSTSGSWPGSS